VLPDIPTTTLHLAQVTMRKKRKKKKKYRHSESSNLPKQRRQGVTLMPLGFVESTMTHPELPVCAS
jgi:hypothetical protein